MKFERLNSSIALNAQEPPSIYMAMCMIESLFRDVEAASGAELSRTAPGDEQLPTKLIWLSRQLLKIHAENRENLLRNRERLGKMMENIKELEERLAEVEQVSTDLHEVKSKAASLEAKLQEAENARREAEQLEAQCKQTQDRLKLLGSPNPDAIRADLAKLSDQEHTLTARQTELNQKREQLHGAISELKAACENLEKDAAQCRNQQDALAAKKQTVENELTTLRADIEQRKKDLSAQAKEKDALMEEQAFLETQITRLRQEAENYEQVNLAPIRAEHRQQEEKCVGLNTELDMLKKDRDVAVLQVARLSQQVASAQQAREEKQQELQKKQQDAKLAYEEAERLQAQLAKETDRLAELQKTADELEQKQNELEHHIEMQTRQNEEYKDSISCLVERKQKLELEVDRKEKDTDALSAEVAKLTEKYTELATSAEANSERVQQLRKDVEELQGRNDQEKRTRLLHQLEDKKQELRLLAQSCDELKRQLADSQAKLEREEQKWSSLQSQKQTADDAIRKINVLVQELAPLGGDALQRQVSDLQKRQSLLEKSYEQLEGSLSLMQSVLDMPTGAFSINLEGLSESLRVYGGALGKLQNALIKCADAVKNEIKIDSSMEEK